jgi:hypothetical protein
MSRWRDLALKIRTATDQSGGLNAHAVGAETAETADILITAPAITTVSTISTAPMFADFEERAAIVEEGAGVPRAWAEAFAILANSCPPSTLDPETWNELINAAGVFLDEWGSQAAALGWAAEELFGLDAKSPVQEHDVSRAALFLGGARVIAMTQSRLVLRRDGDLRTITRRRPTSLDISLRHELK